MDEAFARSFRCVRLVERSRAERERIELETVLLGKGNDDCRAGAEPGPPANAEEDADNAWKRDAGDDGTEGEGGEATATVDEAAVGVELASTSVEEDVVAIVVDGEREGPRNRRDNEREEDFRERSGAGADAEREGAREEGVENELCVVVEEVEKVVLCLGGDVDSEEAVGEDSEWSE